MRARPVAFLVLLSLAPGGCFARKPAGEPFSVVVPYEVTALDPHLDNSVSNFAVLSNVYEPLVITDADMRVQPALAVGWESPDPLTWVLRLRRNVTFHSGHALTARDVVYSLERLRTDPLLDMGAFLHDIVGAEAVDAHTVRVRTTRPVRVLLSKLHFALIVPEGATTASLNRTPDGTGPYRLLQWEQGRSVSLQRFDGHWRPGASLGEVRFVQALAPQAAIDALDDPATGLVQSQSRELEQRARASGRFDVSVRDNIYVKFLAYDLARDETPHVSVRPNPFRNPAVREALDLALDRDALAAALSATATPATQPVPRFIFGYDPAWPGAAPTARGRGSSSCGPGWGRGSR